MGEQFWMRVRSYWCYRYSMQNWRAPSACFRMSPAISCTCINGNTPADLSRKIVFQTLLLHKEDGEVLPHKPVPASFLLIQELSDWQNLTRKRFFKPFYTEMMLMVNLRPKPRTSFAPPNVRVEKRWGKRNIIEWKLHLSNWYIWWQNVMLWEKCLQLSIIVVIIQDYFIYFSCPPDPYSTFVTRMSGKW